MNEISDLLMGDRKLEEHGVASAVNFLFKGKITPLIEYEEAVDEMEAAIAPSWSKNENVLHVQRRSYSYLRISYMNFGVIHLLGIYKN